MKIKKCAGCGINLQHEFNNKEGYIKNIDQQICERCFKLKNYGEYKITTKNNDDYINILKNIDKTDDLVLYVVDIFNLNYDNDLIFKYIKNDVILVITKKDIVPKSVKEYKLLEYFNNSKFKDVLIVSSLKNLNIDRLKNSILKYKKSKNVYVVGKTNAGKSTLINKFIKNYSNLKYDVTTSYLPSTTLDIIKIDVNEDIRLIDTPGLIDSGDIINYLDIKDIKIITPKKEIKPITFQISKQTSLIVGDLLRIDTSDNNNFTFYKSNELVVRINSFKNDKFKNLKYTKLFVEKNSDIVVSGLLWIKVTNDCNVDIYSNENVVIYKRKKII